jgi:16S rRNA G527 N7-methylase RsmG
VVLAEPQRRRAAFLELAVERLDLANVKVAVARAETLSGPFDLCFARAFAALGPSWVVAKRLLRPGGRLVYFGGRTTTERRPEGVEPLLPLDSDSVELLRCPFLESAGPLVIMSRQ